MINLFREKREDMVKKKGILTYVFYALGEILLIVIGILLALYLQNKNEDKKTQEAINISIRMLKDEIITNKKNIENVKDYHIMVRDTLNKIKFPKTEDSIQKTLTFWRGMRTPRLQNAAFQTSIQSGSSKGINPILLKTLNSLYTYQDSYNEFNSQSTQIFFNTDFTDMNSITKTMSSVQVTMNDLFYYERELNESYEYCLKQIDSLYNK
jgi:hypothetical protein